MSSASLGIESDIRPISKILHSAAATDQLYCADCTERDHADRLPILVTGASGFVGGRIALRLRMLGHPVRALVRPGAAVRALREAGIKLIEGDLRNREDVLRATEGVSRIYHFAAMLPAVSVPESYYKEVNVTGTSHILQVGKQHGVERIIHCSTIAVHASLSETPFEEKGSSPSWRVYQETKLESELQAQEASNDGLPDVIIRPAGTYGPGDLRLLNLFQSIYLRNFRLDRPSGKLWRGIYVDDLIDGVLICGEHQDALGQRYVLADDRGVTINEAITAIAKAVGAPRPKRQMSSLAAAAGTALYSTLCWPFGIKPPMDGHCSDGFAPFGASSTFASINDLGYRSRVALKDGLCRTAAWYFEQGYLRPKAA